MALVESRSCTNRGERRNVEREALGLARPVEERPRHGLEPVNQSNAFRRGGGQAVAESRLQSRVLQRGADLGVLVPKFRQDRLALLSCRILSVPVEGRGERGIVAIRHRRLLLERRLRPHIGPHWARRLGMLESFVLGGRSFLLRHRALHLNVQ
jgi:hypothetical protein